MTVARMILGVSLIATVAAPVLAEPGQGGKPGFPGGGPMGKGPAMREQVIKQFDKNGDGKLDQQEMAAARQAMQARGLPGKGPGMGGPLGQGKGDGPGVGPGRDEFLKRFDKNGDGKVDEQERAAARKMIEERRNNIK